MTAAIPAFLSGTFIAPVFFAFLFLVPLIILLYLLKLKRTEIVIPSTMLWRQSLEDLTANAPFKKLTLNLLMFLQILAIVLIVIGLARPYVKSEGTSGKNLCLMIDHSASMNTVEDGKSRLDEAKEAARQMIDDMRGGDKIMVVSFADKTNVLAELTDDRSRLRSAVDSIRPTDTRTKIRDVMLIARSLSPNNPDVPAVVSDLELMLISDGRILDEEELTSVALDMNFVQIGTSANNAGIVGFSVRSPADGGGRQAFILVHNESDETLADTLSLYLGGELLAVEEIEADPKGDTEVVFELANLESGLLEARLDLEDDLAVDDQAWLVLRPRAEIKVLVSAEEGATGAYFLQHALALDPRVDLTASTPANFTDTGDNDLIIFSGWAPESLPRGTLVFFNALPPLMDVSSAGEVSNPPVLARDSDHPVMRFINPGNIRINKAMKLAVPEGSRTLVSTKTGPLVADVSRGGQQMLVVGFDIAESNWPLNLSFPLFIQNLLSWTPKSKLGGDAVVATGDPIPIMPVPGVEKAQVTKPDGSEVEVDLDPLRTVFFGETEEAGLYAVELGEQTDYYAVNLLDRNESSVAPAESLSLGRGEVAGQRGRVKQDRELWRWLLLFALVALAVEWLIYSRRAWI